MDILGTGLKFPLEFDSKGELVLISGSDCVKQDLIDLLTTQLGTRPFLGQYGSRLQELRYIQNTDILRSLATTYITDAFLQENRVVLQSVDIEQQDTQFNAIVTYKNVLSTKIESMVVPFFNTLKEWGT
jgi:phage baseplate assembly protein W